MAITLTTEQQGQVRIVAIDGRLDADGAVDLELGLQELEAGGARHFVIDAAGLIYASNAGLKALTGLADRQRGKGSVRLAGVPLAVREVFGQAELTQRISLYPDRRAALADHPQARLDPALLTAASQLLGTSNASSAGGEKSSELGQAAARLLGAKAKTEAVPRPRNPTPQPPTREPEPEPGLANKLKRWLGPK